MQHSRTISPASLLGLVAGLIGGMVLVVLLLRLLWGDPTPQLTLDAYLNAVDQWNEQAPANYDVKVEVRGSQPATYYVQVRNGEARSAFRNGAYLPQLRSHETWSVDGMFATLAQDVSRLETAEKEQTGPPFYLRVAFDPLYGYPAHYRRNEYSFPIEVEWDVLKFEPLPEDSPWGEKYPAD